MFSLFSKILSIINNFIKVKKSGDSAATAKALNLDTAGIADAFVSGRELQHCRQSFLLEWKRVKIGRSYVCMDLLLYKEISLMS